LAFPSCILDKRFQIALARQRGTDYRLSILRSGDNGYACLAHRADEDLSMFRQKRLRGPAWKFLDGKSSRPNRLTRHCAGYKSFQGSSRFLQLLRVLRFDGARTEPSVRDNLP
jgi:hypothetical protein